MKPFVNVSAPPHIRGDESTARIMADVLIALVPCGAVGVYLFGLSALWVILTCVAACVLTEFVYEKCMKRPVTVGDLSAAVTGLLLAYSLPATVPLWLAALGGVFAILVVKQVFGGIGQNIMNPALAARCFLLISFPIRMTSYPQLVDAVTGATPLTLLKAGQSVDPLQMVFGVYSGCIGETSVIAIAIGAIYLLLRRVISWRIPVTYLVSAAGFMALLRWLTGAPVTAEYLVIQLCGGGLMLGAFFMATDYTTSPITQNGKLLYGLLLGFLTALFRVLGKSGESVSYVIIIANLLVPLIEKITLPRAFGERRKRV
ncbi:MAG: RnfABCDGE type electron transport complex subunit D [Clostridia bacterium]|nr:RnfABCDGE type electron transport complex subunit D [Clostridia bacterium]